MKAVFTSVAWGLLLFILAVVNLFWESWSMSAPFSGFPKSPAPAGVNLLIVVVFASIRIGWFLKEHMVPAPKLRPWIIWSVVGYFAVLLLGAGGYTAARLVEGPRPMATQTTVCNILPEGTIQFTTTDETPYTGKAPLDKFYFANSDFVHVDRLMDKDGRPLAFTTRHEDSTSTYYYSGKLNDPIQPGTVIGLKMEGSMTGRISTNAPDTYSFREQHWPANGIRTRRIEVYRLPPGAQLLQSKPPAATRVLPDGRIELRFDKHIPPGGNISVEFDYRLLKDDQKN